MTKNINLAEILKDCPSGMELDCTIWDNVVFDHVDMTTDYPIYIKKMGGQIEYLTENGCFNFDLGAKCVIFPKGKTTWQGFAPPSDVKQDKITPIFKIDDIIQDENSYKVKITAVKQDKITPIFKIDDIIQDENSYKLKITAVNIEAGHYECMSLISKRMIGTIAFNEQDEWKLVKYQVGDRCV